jgi:hypothetical protein
MLQLLLGWHLIFKPNVSFTLWFVRWAPMFRWACYCLLIAFVIWACCCLLTAWTNYVQTFWVWACCLHHACVTVVVFEVWICGDTMHTYFGNLLLTCTNKPMFIHPSLYLQGYHCESFFTCYRGLSTTTWSQVLLISLRNVWIVRKVGVLCLQMRYM